MHSDSAVSFFLGGSIVESLCSIAQPKEGGGSERNGEFDFHHHS